jgi:C4-dicarboxylate-specific signal transduction histidine kinase
MVTAPIPLRRELLISFAILFGAAIVLAVNALLLLLPRLETPAHGTLFVTLLLVADLGILFVFGSWLLGQRLVTPLERLTASVQRIAGGDYEERPGGADSVELIALEKGVNAMADRLIRDQQVLADNVRSLDRTNAELVEARNQVVQHARLASVGTLAAGIAHEVGNPLGAIMAFVDLATQRAEREGTDAKLLHSIRGEAGRIDRIVRSLLDYARPRGEQSVAAAVAPVIARVRELLEAQGKLEDVAHDWRLEDDAPPVVMVSHRLEQVLVNLLLNALDALADQRERRIVVSLTSDRGEAQTLPIRRENDPAGINYMHRRRVARDEGGKGVDPVFSAERVVVITVEDNGPGIAEADLPKIFDPFFTTKEPGRGTGLGLSICGRLVESMGGRIEADRSPEGGARFTIRLPGATLDPVHAAEILEGEAARR